MIDETNSHGPIEGLTADSDVLGFFYVDAISSFHRLRDDAERLADFAGRLGGLIREAGIAATATHRAEFHRAAEAFQRTAQLTGRLVACLDIKETSP